MQPPIDFTELEKSLSKERLTPYRLQPGDSNSVVVARYIWNFALSQALYPSLHLLEVSLRNRIHASASVKFSPIWLKDTGIVLNDEMKLVQKAIDSLAKDGKKIASLLGSSPH